MVLGLEIGFVLGAAVMFVFMLGMAISVVAEEEKNDKL